MNKFLLSTLFFPAAFAVYSAEGDSLKAEMEQTVALRRDFPKMANKYFSIVNDEETRIYFIYSLGELRSEESVDFLLSNLSFANAGLTKRVPYCGTIPSATALTKIGIPSVKPILKKLSTGIDDETMKILCGILIDIYGMDMARYVLVKEKDSAKGEAGMRITKCIDVVDGYIEMQKARMR